MLSKKERDEKWAKLTPTTQAKVIKLMGLVAKNPGRWSSWELSDQLGLQYSEMGYLKRLVNERLWDQGLQIRHPVVIDGWVWEITSKWPGVIREATMPLMKYLRTLTETLLDAVTIAYNDPTFNRRSAEGRVVNRLMHSLQASLVSAQDMADEMDALIP